MKLTFGSSDSTVIKNWHSRKWLRLCLFLFETCLQSRYRNLLRFPQAPPQLLLLHCRVAIRIFGCYFYCRSLRRVLPLMEVKQFLTLHQYRLYFDCTDAGKIDFNAWFIFTVYFFCVRCVAAVAFLVL